MTLFDLIRSILQIKVLGKGEYENGHYYPAPYYWIWRWQKV